MKRTITKASGRGALIDVDVIANDMVCIPRLETIEFMRVLGDQVRLAEY